MISANREDSTYEVNTSSVVTTPVGIDLSNSAADDLIEGVTDDVPTPEVPVSTNETNICSDIMAPLIEENQRVPRDK